jgi:hypothetical protein
VLSTGNEVCEGVLLCQEFAILHGSNTVQCSTGTTMRSARKIRTEWGQGSLFWLAGKPGANEGPYFWPCCSLSAQLREQTTPAHRKLTFLTSMPQEDNLVSGLAVGCSAGQLFRVFAPTCASAMVAMSTPCCVSCCHTSDHNIGSSISYLVSPRTTCAPCLHRP